MVAMPPLIPPGARASFIDLDGGRVRLLSAEPAEATSRSPLLLIHGGGSDNAAISWFHMFENFGDGRRVVAMDLPGFGYTEGIEAAGDPRLTADFVARVAAAVGFDRAVVIGVSMGGDIAMNLALRFPLLVERLVLIGPGGLLPRMGSKTAQALVWAATRLPDAVIFPMAAQANKFVDQAVKSMVADVGTLPPEVREEFAKEARRNAASEGYLRYNQATVGRRAMRNNLLPKLHALSTPTLIFHGADDPIVNPRGSQIASRSLPDARLVLVPNCGHWAQLEAADRFEAEVRGFLGDR